MNLVFYHIYTLGFSGAPQVNDFLSEPDKNLDKLYEWIDYLDDMGFNAIYFGPVFESTSHGYDTVDYYSIDRRLGTNNSFTSLCGILKSRGFHIVLDGVFNHVSRDFAPFKDIQVNGEESEYCDWFLEIDFAGKSSLGDSFSYHCWEGHDSLVSMNLQNGEVQKYLLNAVKFWIDEFSIDGLRLDVAYCLDKSFLKKLKSFTKALNEDFWIMGEVIHGDYREWLDRGLLDSVTNYECYKGIHSSLNDNNYYEIAHSLTRLFGYEGIYRNYQLYNFIDNHDVSRIYSILEKKAHVYNAMVLLFTIPGIPSIYYGSEWQIEGEKTETSDFLLRPDLNLPIVRTMEKSLEMEKTVRKLISIRKNSVSLQQGAYRELHVNSNQLVFAREFEGEVTICALNSSDDGIMIELPEDLTGNYRDLLNTEDVSINRGNRMLHLWPNWGAVLKSTVDINQQ